VQGIFQHHFHCKKVHTILNNVQYPSLALFKKKLLNENNTA
jgi:hypothetical protein